MQQMSRPPTIPTIRIRSPSLEYATKTHKMQDREGLLANDADREKSWQPADFENARPSKRNTISSAIKDYFYLIATALLLLIVTLQLAILHALSPASCALQIGTEHHDPSPAFPVEIAQWRADPSFAPLTAAAFLSPAVQGKWETLLPPSAAASFPADGLVYNSTSLTHQLHCVYIMGKIFSAVLTHAADMPEPEDYEAHFLHCVDYMRQAAMCAGDVAIEPRGERAGEKGPVSLENAFNGRHVCKEYGAVRGYLEEQLREGKRDILPLDD